MPDGSLLLHCVSNVRAELSKTLAIQQFVASALLGSEVLRQHLDSPSDSVHAAGTVDKGKPFARRGRKATGLVRVGRAAEGGLISVIFAASSCSRGREESWAELGGL